MIGMSSGFSLSVLNYNLHLFGNTARYQLRGVPQETGFYFRDEERFSRIVERLRTSGADVIGLTEVWDDAMRVEMEAELRSEYPYSVASPAGRTPLRVVRRRGELFHQVALHVSPADLVVRNRFVSFRGSFGARTRAVAAFGTRLGRGWRRSGSLERGRWGLSAKTAVL